jgi:hypothetical protein
MEGGMALLKYLCFENPLTLLVVLGLAALVAGIAWMRSGSKRARIAAVACLAIGVSLTFVAWAVETDHEKIVRTLDAMARAVKNGDADALLERVSDRYQNGASDKSVLAGVVRTALKQVRATAEMPVIERPDDTAKVTQVYRFRPAPGWRPLVPREYERVTWEGVLARDPDGEWRLRSATATQPRRITPEEAERYLQRGAP